MNKRRTTLTVLALIASLGLSSAPVWADKGGNGNGHGHNGNQGNKAKGNENDQGLVSVSISRDRARSLARNYGLTGYRSLPPGIAKNLARGKPLPPGIAKKMVPSPMLHELPYYPGYEWRIAGDDLVLVALSTALVASVINGVFN
ncbi:Predicted integral membrane protein [Serratia quinivorans]|uniref:RcnB family protein n=1 Tax=Serratia quinivorans TaxID=137545 RepID=UPI002179F795|nr:RcnB family protein [Serratia quinivorans]CAI1506795.1 Predicted integral membrane protein [Serratia quinivorans]